MICDRFEDSTKAYQGYGRGLDLKGIDELGQKWVRGKLKPDLTFLLDIDPEVGMKRGGRRDRIEKESFRFHKKVRKGFLDLARKNPKRFVVIRTDQDRDTVSRKISEVLNRVL